LILVGNRILVKLEDFKRLHGTFPATLASIETTDEDAGWVYRRSSDGSIELSISCGVSPPVLWYNSAAAEWRYDDG
jgi:hypothetical protein